MLRNRNKNRIRNNKSAGFSLIEILIVTVITTVVFTVIYSFYSASIKQSVESRYEMIASNLAQEGIEIIRNVRDENKLRGDEINEGLPTSGSCFPLISSGITSCSSSGGQDIKIDLGGWYVNSSFGEDTPFTRSCSITSNVEKITAKCTVEWKSFVNSGLTREATATAILTDWQ